ncbi:MAG: two-component system sensor histidine kinase NtrB, partial [Croceibacterium sp.]
MEQIERGYSDEVEAPPIVPIDLDEELPRAGRDRRVHVPQPEESGGAQDIESVAARRLRAKRGSLRWPLSRLQTGILALALLDTILVGWRSDVVRALPQTASFYSLLGLSVNLRGLVFDNVATVTEQHEGVPILVVDPEGALVAVNEAAERLFGQGLSLLARGRFAAALPSGSALVSLLERALEEDAAVRERGVEISLFGLPSFEADLAAAPLGDGSVLLTLHVRGGALAVERGGAEAAGLRTIVGLGRMLAHEIKNPLAGIRGAAQLLKAGAKAEDTPLAQLIVDETDRVARLIDRMEAFSEDVHPASAPVNIHQVLDRVRALAANGVADGLALHERYDPSLPPVLGDEDQLIQIFLNLVKNAAEAAHSRGDGRGAISIHTAYR